MFFKSTEYIFVIVITFFLNHAISFLGATISLGIVRDGDGCLLKLSNVCRARYLSEHRFFVLHHHCPQTHFHFHNSLLDPHLWEHKFFITMVHWINNETSVELHWNLSKYAQTTSKIQCNLIDTIAGHSQFTL